MFNDPASSEVTAQVMEIMVIKNGSRAAQEIRIFGIQPFASALAYKLTVLEVSSGKPSPQNQLQTPYHKL